MSGTAGAVGAERPKGQRPAPGESAVPLTTPLPLWTPTPKAGCPTRLIRGQPLDLLLLVIKDGHRRPEHGPVTLGPLLLGADRVKVATGALAAPPLAARAVPGTPLGNCRSIRSGLFVSGTC